MKKLILLLFLITSCSTVKNKESIELIRKEKLFNVEVTLNNSVKVPFIVDTGATITSIPSYVIITLIKAGKIKKHHFIGEKSFTLADGSVVKNTVVLLDEMDIDGVKIYNVKCTVTENMDSPLLLGQNALEKIGKITLNY